MPGHKRNPSHKRTKPFDHWNLEQLHNRVEELTRVATDLLAACKQNDGMKRC